MEYIYNKFFKKGINMLTINLVNIFSMTLISSIKMVITPLEYVIQSGIIGGVFFMS